VQNRIQDKVDIGIVAFMAYSTMTAGDKRVVQDLESLAEDDYFQVLEVSHVEDKQLRNRLRECACEKGRQIAFGSHPTLLSAKLNLNHPDKSERKNAIDAVKRDIDEAYEWEAIGLTVLSGPDPGCELRKDGTDLLAESLKELCEYSHCKGSMPIVLEVFDRIEFAKNCLIGPCEEAAELAEKVKTDFPDFRVLVDQAHMTLMRESPEYCLGTLKDYLSYVHVGNCVVRNCNHPAYGDNHPRFGIEDGENGLDEIEEFLRALNGIGYFENGKKIISFELKPCPGEDIAEIIEESKTLLNQAWNRL
jgi:sugar phosphate isomerase/epimerase